jgi:hypothetical protein
MYTVLPFTREKRKKKNPVSTNRFISTAPIDPFVSACVRPPAHLCKSLLNSAFVIIGP